MSAIGAWLSWPLVIVSLLGGIWVRTLDSQALARRLSALIATLSLVLSVLVSNATYRSPGHMLSDPLAVLGLDALSALLVPLTALLGWALVLAAPRSWARPVALGRLLLNLALVSLSFLVRDVWAFAVLWALTLVPTWLELRRTEGDRGPARVYALYAGASAVLFAIGLVMIGMPLSSRADVWNVYAWTSSDANALRVCGLVILLIAVFIRKATLPFHSWLTTVFAAAPPGPVLLLVAPMVGAYALVRFAVPLFPEWLGEHGYLLPPLALLTAAYAAGLAFVQTELRRIVAWIAISQSALVLVGLECPEGAGLTGALVAWLSVAAGMTGLGLSAWMLEARFGPLSVTRPLGLYRRSRALSVVFLLCGLSLVGFPGTVGFASDDLLLSAVLDSFPFTGLLLFFATALSGFTILRTYMRLFHGPPARGPELALLPREWLALLVPLGLVIWQGLYPAPLVGLGAEASHSLLARIAQR